MTSETYHEIVKHLAKVRTHLEQAQTLAKSDQKLHGKITKMLSLFWLTALYVIEQELKCDSF